MPLEIHRPLKGQKVTSKPGTVVSGTYEHRSRLVGLLVNLTTAQVFHERIRKYQTNGWKVTYMNLPDGHYLFTVVDPLNPLKAFKTRQFERATRTSGVFGDPEIGFPDNDEQSFFPTDTAWGTCVNVGQEGHIEVGGKMIGNGGAGDEFPGTQDTPPSEPDGWWEISFNITDLTQYPYKLEVWHVGDEANKKTKTGIRVVEP